MANLPEASAWEPGIYQIEKTDPVDGGPDGISNSQAKQLANRTVYLKDQINQKAPLASPLFTGNPAAPTQMTGDNSTRLANTAFVQAAIAALVDSSPGTLDTLNELAAALGDDPNFASTIMTTLTGKADILRGVPTGTVMIFTGSVAPMGSVKGAGALLSRTTYADLYAHAVASNMIVTDAEWLAGATGFYSHGDGVSSFRVPLVDAEFFRFWDNGRGVDAGRTLGSWQDSANKAHIHTNTMVGLNAFDHTSGSDFVGADSNIVTSLSGVSAINPSGGPEARPRNLAYLGIIKY